MQPPLAAGSSYGSPIRYQYSHVSKHGFVQDWKRVLEGLAAVGVSAGRLMFRTAGEGGAMVVMENERMLGEFVGLDWEGMVKVGYV